MVSSDIQYVMSHLSTILDMSTVRIASVMLVTRDASHFTDGFTPRRYWRMLLVVRKTWIMLEKERCNAEGTWIIRNLLWTNIHHASHENIKWCSSREISLSLSKFLLHWILTHLPASSFFITRMTERGNMIYCTNSQVAMVENADNLQKNGNMVIHST